MTNLSSLSRYEVSPGITTDGKLISIRKNADQVTVSRYIVLPGETIEVLAHRLYGDPTQWWRIADVNPQVPFPLDISPGMEIRLPR